MQTNQDTHSAKMTLRYSCMPKKQFCNRS